MEIILGILTTLGVILGGANVWQFIENRRYRKEISELKKIEVKNGEYDLQSKGLDLVEKFYEKVQKVTDDYNVSLKEKLKEIKDVISEHGNMLTEIITEQVSQKEFLNGEYTKWKKEHTK